MMEVFTLNGGSKQVEGRNKVGMFQHWKRDECVSEKLEESRDVFNCKTIHAILLILPITLIPGISHYKNLSHFIHPFIYIYIYDDWSNYTVLPWFSFTLYRFYPYGSMDGLLWHHVEGSDVLWAWYFTHLDSLPVHVALSRRWMPYYTLDVCDNGL